MSKIWICGQVAAEGQEKNIYELVKVFHYFDGACWTVNYREDQKDLKLGGETYSILDATKKEGRILKCDWVNLHFIGMTMFLQCGRIKNGDWVLVVDAQELPKEKWLQEMRSKVEEYEKNGVETVFWGRPYFFKFNDQMQYHGSTHCWPSPLGQKHISIQDEPNVKYDEGGVHFGHFLYNKKNLDDTILLHGLKYIWCYDITNEMQNIYGQFGEACVVHHETLRRNFRNWALNDLGLKPTLESLTEYMSKKEKMDQKFIVYVETEGRFKDFFRFSVLKHSREQILANRHKWSLINYLEKGDEIQYNTEYVSTHNKYREQIGQPHE